MVPAGVAARRGRRVPEGCTSSTTRRRLPRDRCQARVRRRRSAGCAGRGSRLLSPEFRLERSSRSGGRPRCGSDIAAGRSAFGVGRSGAQPGCGSDIAASRCAIGVGGGPGARLGCGSDIAAGRSVIGVSSGSGTRLGCGSNVAARRSVTGVGCRPAFQALHDGPPEDDRLYPSQLLDYACDRQAHYRLTQLLEHGVGGSRNANDLETHPDLLVGAKRKDTVP